MWGLGQPAELRDRDGSISAAANFVLRRSGIQQDQSVGRQFLLSTEAFIAGLQDNLEYTEDSKYIINTLKLKRELIDYWIGSNICFSPRPIIGTAC